MTQIPMSEFEEPIFDLAILGSIMQLNFFNSEGSTGGSIDMGDLDLPGFSDINEGFHSWVSIGHMG